MQPLESDPLDQRIKQIVERQAQAWEMANSEQIIADFSEDSLFIIPGNTFRGKRQIKEAAERYFSEFTETKVTIKRIIVNGNEAAVEWTWREKNKVGEISQAEDVIIFELKDGKIKYWREYIEQSPRN